MSLNKVMLIGHIDDKPQVRQAQGGAKKVGLSVVTMQCRHDPKTGEETTGREWHRVVITEPQMARFAERNLKQNDQVYIEGQLHTESWQDETFQERSLTTVLLCQQGDQLRRLATSNETAEVSATEQEPKAFRLKRNGSPAATLQGAA